MTFGLTKLSATKKHLAKLEAKKEKNAKRVTLLENSIFVIGRGTRIQRHKDKIEKLDEGITADNKKLGELYDKDLLNNANKFLRKITGAKYVDPAAQYNDEPKTPEDSNKPSNEVQEDNNAEFRSINDKLDYIVPIVLENVTKISKINQIKPAEVNSSENKTTSDSNDVQKVSEISDTNLKLYDYLVNKGEAEKAEALLEVITAPPEEQGSIKKLSETNELILEQLTEINENQIDEQDTTIKKTSQTPNVVNTETTVIKEVEDKDDNWFMNMFKSLFGAGLLSMFLGAKNLKPAQIAMKIFKYAAKGISVGIAKVGSEAMKYITKLVEPIVVKLKKGVKYVEGLIKSVSTMLNNAKKYIKELVGKIPKNLKWLIPDKLNELAGIKSVSKEAGKVGEKAVTKASQKGLKKALVKSLGKKVPVLSLVVATGLAAGRIADGDYGMAGMEIASGILATLPGLGTVGSFGVDAMIMQMDNSKQGMSPEVQKQFDENVIKERIKNEKLQVDGKLKSDEKLIELKKEQKTLLEERTQLTSNGGLAIKGNRDKFKEIIESQKQLSIKIQARKEEVELEIEDDVRTQYKEENKPKSVNLANIGVTQLDSDGEVFKLYQDPDTKGLNEGVKENLLGLGQEYFKTYGTRLQINSAYRSFEEQAALKKASPNKAASAGYSMHNYGLAIDLNSSDLNKAEKSGMLKKYNFHRPVKGEPWHMEPTGIDRKAIRSAGMAQYEKENNKVDTNEVLSAKTEGKEPQTPTSDKSAKEGAVQASNNNLVNNTKTYNSSKSVVQTQSDSTQNVVINTSKSAEARLLDSFSTPKL